VYELQNIDKTIFDDEMSTSSTLEKVEQVTGDIQKSTTVETRAIYLCRRGALLRKVILMSLYTIADMCMCTLYVAWKIY